MSLAQWRLYETMRGSVGARERFDANYTKSVCCVGPGNGPICLSELGYDLWGN